MIESKIIWEGTEDKGEMYLLISLKCIVIVTEPGSPILNTPHSMIRGFCETKVGYFQHNTKVTTYYYSQEDNAALGLTRNFIQIFGGFHPSKNKMFL